MLNQRTRRTRALDELRAIEATRHIENGDIKTYCLRVSDTLREYLARGCQIPAFDLTPAELALVMKQTNVPAPVAVQVVHVLRVCAAAGETKDYADMETLKTLVQISQQIVLLYPPVTEPQARAK